ncbi:hypothetical protein [Dokdonella sp.]|uniref:hypothetical protein n=1 Tax=Dokdonella sp. TaxID=2291710 RepID=UPI00352744B2
MPQRWRNYALSSITPGFSWAPAPTVEPPSVTDANDIEAQVALAFGSTSGRSGSSLNLSVAEVRVGQRAHALSSPQLDVSSQIPGVGLTRTVIAPSWVTRWGEQGLVGVTAVLAYQRYASLGMGEAYLNEGMPLWPVVPGETSYGAGLRVDVGNALVDKLSWNASIQSTIDMDSLNSLRGVYSDPGQFDIPASASLGLSYALSPALSLDVGAERVMYSQVTPFTSPALPRHFLALLGSGASPDFAWEDLTVYSAGWTFADARAGIFELRYTTRQQPQPTSALLRTALGVDTADHTVGFGYTKITGPLSKFSVQAVYSSAPYFLGVPSYRSSNRYTGSQFEYEAAWTMQF